LQIFNAKGDSKMVAKDIEQFANGISSAITDAVAIAKNDYKQRLEAIESFYTMPDVIIQAGGVSRANLAKGAEGEMQRVQGEQNRAIEAEIKKVDKKLSSLRGNPERTADIVYLTGKLAEWNKRSEEIAIPKGPHSSAHTVSATKSMIDIQEKWEKFCQTDPTIQKAALYEQKAKLDQEISVISTEIAELEKKIPCLNKELDDRNTNGAKYEQQVKAEVSEEVESISIQLRHAEEDVTDLENQEKSIQTQLTSSGFFAFGKKKELKAQLEKLATDISDAKSKASEIEKKKKATADSLPLRINGLKEKITQLTEEISRSEQLLAADKKKLSEMQTELVEVEAKLS